MLICLGAQPAPLPTAEDLEARALNARKRVVRGEFLIDARDVQGSRNPVPKEYHLWFDGSKLREDCRLVSPEGRPVRQIRCRNCQTSDGFIRYNHDPAMTGAVNAVQLTRITANDQANPWFEVLDPRGLNNAPRCRQWSCRGLGVVGGSLDLEG